MATTRGMNWFAVWVSAAVVVVLLGLGGLVVFLNSQAMGERPSGGAVEPESSAITVGEGAVEVAIWFDFYCPHCQDFEDLYGPTLHELVEEGTITLQLQPVALSGLNAASGTSFSERSANALYCVADAAPESTLTFFQELFALKPSGPGVTDDELISLANQVGASAASECITDGTYRSFAASQSASIPPNPETGRSGTPSLLVDGQYVPLTGSVDADLLERVRTT